MLLEHERNYGFGMDALVTVCFSNTNGIMVLAYRCQILHPCRYAARPENAANMGIKWPLAASQVQKTPRLSAKLSFNNSLKTALCCPATKHCENGHKMAFGSLASAENPTPVSKIELLQPAQNRAVTPGWREEPVLKVPT